MLRNISRDAGSTRLLLSIIDLVLVALLLCAGIALVAAAPSRSGAGGITGLVTPTATATATATATSTSDTSSTATFTPAPPTSTPTATPTIQSACVVGWSLVGRPTSDQLSDVSVVEAHEAWMVGGPNALRWVSGTWTVQNISTVLPQPQRISGSAPDNVWAANDTKLARWNGSGWTPVAYPTPTVVAYPSPYRDTAFIHTIRARSVNDVWVGGGYNGVYGSSCVTWKYCYPFVGHWNGTSWEIIESPNPAGAAALRKPDGASLSFLHYDGIGFISSTETWLVGSNDQWAGGIYDSYPIGVHCVNTNCIAASPLNAGTLTALRAIDGAATNDVWTVGSVGFAQSTLIEHWNGTEWSVVSSPSVGPLSGVTAVAPDDVWAVGPSVVLHYDGTSWQQATAPAGASAIDSRGPYNVWAVGGVVMHYPNMPIFSDVSPDNPFYCQIQELSCRGIISGYSDATFRPNNFVTRGQQAKIVSNAAGFTEPASGQAFQDVAPGSTFYEFVQRLASRGYISGYQCGGPGEPCVAPGNLPYFRTNTPVTRGQIAKIVSNAAGFADPAGAQIFEDVSPGSTFYDFVQRLASRGFMNGYGCGGSGEPCNPPGNRPYFRPNVNATRGQTSKIVANTFFPVCNSAAVP